MEFVAAGRLFRDSITFGIIFRGDPGFPVGDAPDRLRHESHTGWQLHQVVSDLERRG